MDIDPNLKSIEEIFNGSAEYYFTPRFQRSFSWDKVEIQQFWDDIKDVFYNKNSRSYFLGFIIVKSYRDKDYLEIIDGQQRLAALTIFFACIRDIIIEMPGVQDAAAIRIQERYMEKSDIGGRTRQYKLKLNKEDLNFFSSNISNYDSSLRGRFGSGRQGRLPRSHGLIKKAYEILREEILKELELQESSEDKQRLIIDFANVVAKKFQVIESVVQDEVDAYLIFETLNDRGLDLSIADLLKNHLYAKAEQSKNLSEVQSEWEEIIKILEKHSISIFLRHYWISFSLFIRSKELYQEFKKYLKKENNSLSFTVNLKKEAERYYYLQEPSMIYWKNKDITELLKELRILNLKQVYPVLLSGSSVLNDSELIKLLKLCLTLSFRYSTICGKYPGKLEQFYSEIAIALRNRDIGINQIKEKFLKLNPTEKEFLENFQEREIKNPNLARYILAKIEGLKNEDLFKDGELEINKNITLEHIMPKKYKKEEWLNYDENLIFKIGNLTLLTDIKNNEGSNNSFSFKSENIFNQSRLKITKSLADLDVWNSEEISKRQEEFAKLANEYWQI